jgi:hypothetical protein
MSFARENLVVSRPEIDSTQQYTVDTPLATPPIILVRHLVGYGFQRIHRQSLAFRCLTPAKSTACCSCYPQTTTSRHIGWLSAPFFSLHSHLVGHVLIFGIDIALQPRL